MTTKTRDELKAFFVKNAIPTQGNFADLIDGQINQAEDGIFKREGEPVSLVAGAGEQRRVLQIYAEYPAANPDWLLSLNPKHPTAASGNLAGFGIADGAGNTRLVLDAAGNLTVTGDLSTTGTATVLGGIVAGPIKTSGNAGVLDIEGSDHAYIQWFPMKRAAGRRCSRTLAGNSATGWCSTSALQRWQSAAR